MPKNIIRFREYKINNGTFVEQEHSYRTGRANIVLARFKQLLPLDNEVMLMEVKTTKTKFITTDEWVASESRLADNGLLGVDEYVIRNGAFIKVETPSTNTWEDGIQLYVNPAQIVIAKHVGYNLNGNDVWEFTCSDNSKFICDWSGMNAIDQWDNPIIRPLLP
jgi:hypothetical protein